LTVKGIARAGIIHKPFVTHSGSISKTSFGSVECGAFEVKNFDFMGDTMKYDASRPVTYINPFTSHSKLTQNSRSQTLGINDLLDSTYPVKIATSIIRYE
jgi:hypothetical protein